MLIPDLSLLTKVAAQIYFNQTEKNVIYFSFSEIKLCENLIKIALLRTFAIVSECGNIKDAADRLGRTPSAISMALKQLEDELGSKLFEADRKNALTPLGRYVLDIAEEELTRFERAISGMHAFAKNEIGRLEIACVPSVAVRILPDVIKDFVAVLPKVQLEVRDMDSASVRRAVERGQVELGIASLNQPDGSLDYTELFADDFGVVSAIYGPLTAVRRPLQWSDLGGHELISNGLSRSITDPTYRALEQHSKILVRNVTSILALVRRGIGVTLLPRLAVPPEDKEVCFLPLAAPSARRHVGIIRRAGVTLSPVAQAFSATLIKHPPEGLKP